jgi:hypothetical protein
MILFKIIQKTILKTSVNIYFIKITHKDIQETKISLVYKYMT